MSMPHVRFALGCAVALAACGDNVHFDRVSLVVSPSGSLRTNEAGAAAHFTVSLTAKPDDRLTVLVSASNTGEGTVSPSRLSFTQASFDHPQTVTVTPVDDDIVDGNQPFVVRLAATDPSMFGPIDVDVINDDNDTAGVAVTPLVGLRTTEAGGQARFAVALTARPQADVHVPLASSDLAEGTVDPTELMFTADDWNVPQTVTATGVDDAVADGGIGYRAVLEPLSSADPAFDALDPDDVLLVNMDDDIADFVVTPTSGLQTNEGGSQATFSVTLTAQPTHDVTVAVSSADTTEGSAAPSSLVFTAANWNVAQLVTVTGVADGVADGDQTYDIVLAPAASIDLAYDGVDPADVSVTNLDRGLGGVTVSPVTGLVVSEFAGDTATFTIVLDSAPTGDVTIPLTPSDITQATVLPASVTFTTANWNLPKTVTVSGVNDAVADGNRLVTILTGAAVSADGAYSGLNASDVQVAVIDIQSAQVYVRRAPLLVTTEAGGTATFQVRLTVAPTKKVTCTLSSTDTTEGTVNPASIQFTPGGFGFVTVTVTGVDDLVVDGDQMYSIATAACTSADPAYNGFDPPDVSVVNRDND